MSKPISATHYIPLQSLPGSPQTDTGMQIDPPPTSEERRPEHFAPRLRSTLSQLLCCGLININEPDSESNDARHAHRSNIRTPETSPSHSFQRLPSGVTDQPPSPLHGMRRAPISTNTSCTSPLDIQKDDYPIFNTNIFGSNTSSGPASIERPRSPTSPWTPDLTQIEAGIPQGVEAVSALAHQHGISPDNVKKLSEYIHDQNLVAIVRTTNPDSMDYPIHYPGKPLNVKCKTAQNCGPVSGLVPVNPKFSKIDSTNAAAMRKAQEQVADAITIDGVTCIQLTTTRELLDKQAKRGAHSITDEGNGTLKLSSIKDGNEVIFHAHPTNTGTPDNPKYKIFHEGSPVEVLGEKITAGNERTEDTKEFPFVGDYDLLACGTSFAEHGPLDIPAPLDILNARFSSEPPEFPQPASRRSSVQKNFAMQLPDPNFKFGSPNIDDTTSLRDENALPEPSDTEPSPFNTPPTFISRRSSGINPLDIQRASRKNSSANVGIISGRLLVHLEGMNAAICSTGVKRFMHGAETENEYPDVNAILPCVVFAPEAVGVSRVAYAKTLDELTFLYQKIKAAGYVLPVNPKWPELIKTKLKSISMQISTDRLSPLFATRGRKFGLHNAIPRRGSAPLTVGESPTGTNDIFPGDAPVRRRSVQMLGDVPALRRHTQPSISATDKPPSN